MASNPTLKYIEIIVLSRHLYPHTSCNQDVFILASVAIKVRNQHSLKQKKKLLSFASRCTNLEIFPKQIDQVQKDKDLAYGLNLKQVKFIET